MSIAQVFDDERHRHSEELAFFADRTAVTFPLEAMAKYAEAAALEEACARDVPDTDGDARTLLAISAVALWVKAGKTAEAARAADFFEQNGKLAPGGVEALRRLVAPSP